MEQTIVPGPPEAMSTVSPSLDAGIALAAIPVLNRYGLPAPTPAAVVAATGASKTTAYKVRSALLEHLPSALQPPGRPPKPPRPEPAEHGLLTEVLRRVLGFVCDHPGSVSGSAAHRSYADSFHCFVLELCGEQQELTLDQLADATTVPLGTLKDWLRGELSQVDAPEPGSPPAATLLPAVPQIETVLLAWANWEGAFRPFCEHVQLDLRVPFTRAHIADILEAEGVRIPKRRGRRQPDASAMKGAFETFFPGAQWVGDGTELTIDLWGHRFSCNLELDVDAASGAFPGASIRPTEDSTAVVEAFVDGVATTGEPPLALLLDNKPSNHAEAVNDALGDTLLMRPRPYTPTDKPHVEGAFGLFAQEAPPLRITADDPGELARQIIALVVTTWLRAVNHRPRADRGGLSRVEIYRQHQPTDDEINRAKAALAERLRKLERARQTQAARQDPIVRAALDRAFDRLKLDDPDGHLRSAIASWSADAILAGIAIFQAKHDAGTLPEGVDARYLRGIVCNLAQEAEGWAIAEALLRERLAARDHALDLLVAQQEAIERVAEDPEQRLLATIDRALHAHRRIDRCFWLLAATDIICDQPPAALQPLLRIAARRVHANSRVPHRERLAAVRFLFAKALPIA